MTEYGREARITFDCAEYLGFDQTEAVADATLEPSERGAEGLRIQVGTQLGSRSTPTRKPWCACTSVLTLQLKRSSAYSQRSGLQ